MQHIARDVLKPPGPKCRHTNRSVHTLLHFGM